MRWIVRQSPSFPRSAWERTSGRSAARRSMVWVPEATQSVATVRSHAERGNEKMLQLPMTAKACTCYHANQHTHSDRGALPR